VSDIYYGFSSLSFFLLHLSLYSLILNPLVLMHCPTILLSVSFYILLGILKKSFPSVSVSSYSTFGVYSNSISLPRPPFLCNSVSSMSASVSGYISSLFSSLVPLF
jgi:hypothetical protein